MTPPAGRGGPAGRALAADAVPGTVPAFRALPSFDLFGMCREAEIPVLVPSDGDPNEPGFVHAMVSDLRPDVGLSIYCRHRLARSLRSAFAHPVNYHDGLLPAYRGVMATAFSIFAGEAESGFSFHRMTGRIDAGPVLLQGSVPVGPLDDLAAVSRRKCRRAAEEVPRLLELLAGGDPGRPQEGKASYFSTQHWMAMIRLTSPENATREEILRRIRAFGGVRVTIAGREYAVTGVRRGRVGEPLAFRTLDGVVLVPERFAEAAPD